MNALKNSLFANVGLVILALALVLGGVQEVQSKPKPPPASVPTEPFQIELVAAFAQGDTVLTEKTGFEGRKSFTVPSGKRLVIEHVTIAYTGPVGQDPTVSLATDLDVKELPMNHH